MDTIKDAPLDALTADGSPSGANVISSLGEFRAAAAALKLAVERYDAERLRIYRLRLEERGLEWCTYRNHPVAKGATRLLFTNSGHHALHAACSECVIDALSGQIDDGDSFYQAQLVSREGRTIVDARSGREIFCRPRDGSDYAARTGVPHGATAQLDLPPKLEWRQGWGEGPRLMIGEADDCRVVDAIT